MDEVFTSDPFPGNVEANDLFNEFPQTIMFKAIPFVKPASTQLSMSKDPYLFYKCGDSKRLNCVSRLKYFLNSKTVKLVVPHSKARNEHKNIMLANLESKHKKSKVEEIPKSKIEKYACLLAIKDKNCTSTDLVNYIAGRQSQNFTLPSEKEVAVILQGVKKRLYTEEIESAEVEMNMISEQFGRPCCRYWNKSLKKEEHALVFYS